MPERLAILSERIRRKPVYYRVEFAITFIYIVYKKTTSVAETLRERNVYGTPHPHLTYISSIRNICLQYTLVILLTTIFRSIQYTGRSRASILCDSHDETLKILY